MARRLRNKRVVAYSDVFKIMVVRLTQIESVQTKQIGECLDLHPLMISRWRKQVRDGTLVAEFPVRAPMPSDKPPPKKKELSQIEKLKKQNARLKKENDLLKKWQRYLKEVRKNDSDS